MILQPNVRLIESQIPAPVFNIPLEVVENKIFSHYGVCSPKFSYLNNIISCSMFQLSADRWWRIILNLNLKDRTYETFDYDITPDQEKTTNQPPKIVYNQKNETPSVIKLKFETAKLYLFSDLARFEINID